MSAIHPAIDAARASGAASGLEGASALRPGGKKKGEGAGGAESLFASILSQAGQLLRANQTGAKALATAPSEAKPTIPKEKTSPSRLMLDRRAGGRRAETARAARLPTAAPRVGQASEAAEKLLETTRPSLKGSAKKESVSAEGLEGRAAESKVKAARDMKADHDERGRGADASAAAPRAATLPAASLRAAGNAGSGDGTRDEGPGAAIAEKKEGDSGGPRVSVADLRKAQGKRAETAARQVQGAEEGAGPVREEGSSSRREVMREIGLGQAVADRGARTDEAAEPAAPNGHTGGADFSSMLAQRLRESGNGEIVQAAHIVLKDGDTGTIRLKLRPESLGNVKIELNLSDKSISGKIVVESDEAKSAFERNMAELSDAFRQGGFETASLEVSVGSGSGRESGGEGRPETGPFFSERLRAAEVAAGPAAAGAYSRRGYAVDMLA